MMKINEFAKQILKRGISRPYRYELELTIPTKLINSEWWSKFSIPSDIGQILSYQCFETNFPSFGLDTDGDVYNIPVSQNFEELKMSIRCGEDLAEKKFFDAWTKTIINQDNYSVAYLDDISTSIILRKIDTKGKNVQSVEFIDAYPNAVTGLEAKQDGKDEIDTFSVQFNFRKWKFV